MADYIQRELTAAVPSMQLRNQFSVPRFFHDGEPGAGAAGSNSEHP